VLELTGISETQRAAAAELADELGIDLTRGNKFVFEMSGDGIEISFDGNTGKVKYAAPHMFARCLGLIAERLKQGKGSFEIHETPVYTMLGVMPDCSRNAVLTVDTFKKLTRHLALMGYSVIQLYTEDTFEMEEYPYFGYLRGRYTKEELKEMDAYAEKFGIELMPCIQTLAHLGRTLRWDAHSDIVDFDGILLVDEEKTYEFIECMFKTMSECLKSRRINIGLDEAHMLGLGKFLDKHGYQNRVTIMLRHIKRVSEIAKKYGYRPMMWSDMFFRLNNNGEYYAPDKPIDPEIIKKIPEDVELVYWDYYNTDPRIVERMINRHKEITDNVIFAGGAVKWLGLAPCNRFSEYVGKIAHECCHENGVKEVIITSWGDFGALNSTFSILPTLQLWAELCYKNNSESEYLSTRFFTCTGGNYDDFMDLSLTVNTPDHPAPGKRRVNPSWYVLWQDILYGLFDKHIDKDMYREHYAHCAKVFESILKKGGKWSYLFKTQLEHSRVLELKCAAGIEIHEAYEKGDKAGLNQIAENILPELRKRLISFHDAERRQWMIENKAFGIDSFDIRIGAQLIRLDTALARIKEYIDGKINRIEELEEKQLYFVPVKDPEDKVVDIRAWNIISTTSWIY
ncbi:MAG: beta-N-acetylhexosaminidase, partial [Clostridiales bacterium]|nr:beta-N-acetylhexosaminidase [Clostridiales bacterium]